MRRQKRRVYVGGKGSERCVFINMLNSEGIGNQLFIFATGLVINEKTGLPLCIVPSDANPHSKNDYRSLFEIPSKTSIVDHIALKERINSANMILDPQNKHRTARWSNANIKYNSASGKNAKIEARLYQNYASIQRVIPTVRATLMENEFSKKPNYRELENATPPKSAFIHVRRGDYAERGWALDEDYYLRGLDILNKDPNIEHIWIISNDLDWSRKIDWAGHTSKIIHFYDSKDELEVLYKMMLCTAGAVVSPSTFSAWGVMMGADMNRADMNRADMTDKPTIVFPEGWLEHDSDPINPLMFPEPKWTKIPNHATTTTTLI